MGSRSQGITGMQIEGLRERRLHPRTLQTEGIVNRWHLSADPICEKPLTMKPWKPSCLTQRSNSRARHRILHGQARNRPICGMTLHVLR